MTNRKRQVLALRVVAAFLVGGAAFVGCNQAEGVNFGRVESWDGEEMCIVDEEKGQSTCYDTTGENFTVEEDIEVGDTVRVREGDQDRIIKVSDR